jgi:hypothetical protein
MRRPLTRGTAAAARPPSGIAASLAELATELASLRARTAIARDASTALVQRAAAACARGEAACRTLAEDQARRRAWRAGAAATCRRPDARPHLCAEPPLLADHRDAAACAVDAPEIPASVTPVELIQSVFCDLEAAATERLAEEPWLDEAQAMDLVLEAAVERLAQHTSPEDLRCLVDALRALARRLHGGRPPCGRGSAASSQPRFHPRLRG